MKRKIAGRKDGLPDYAPTMASAHREPNDGSYLFIRSNPERAGKQAVPSRSGGSLNQADGNADRDVSSYGKTTDAAQNRVVDLALSDENTN
ncbi:MAG: hypothetical protein AAF367_06635 [Pseudomonadota bacterium]